MATANAIPRYKLNGRIGAVSISTANTNLDGTGTIGTVITGVDTGTVIDLIRVKASVTTTAGMIRLFLHDGSNYFLYHELAVSAVTPSGTQAAFSIEYAPATTLILPSSSWSLRASTHNAETFKVFATGGDF